MAQQGYSAYFVDYTDVITRALGDASIVDYPQRAMVH